MLIVPEVDTVCVPPTLGLLTKPASAPWASDPTMVIDPRSPARPAVMFCVNPAPKLEAPRAPRLPTVMAFAPLPVMESVCVLPNAKTLRFIESGSLLALLHKWTLRTCFNAQEEIYLASMDEIEQVAAVHPRLAKHLGPPCVLRNKLVSPRCTEGTHFCGVPVWNSFPKAVRRL